MQQQGIRSASVNTAALLCPPAPKVRPERSLCHESPSQHPFKTLVMCTRIVLQHSQLRFVAVSLLSVAALENPLNSMFCRVRRQSRLRSALRLKPSFTRATAGNELRKRSCSPCCAYLGLLASIAFRIMINRAGILALAKGATMVHLRSISGLGARFESPSCASLNRAEYVPATSHPSALSKLQRAVTCRVRYTKGNSHA